MNRVVEPVKDQTGDVGPDETGAEDTASMIATLARIHGITAERQPVDDFADAASRLSDAEVTLDTTERLLVNLQRAGILDSSEGFALHVAYLRESKPRQ